MFFKFINEPTASFEAVGFLKKRIYLLAFLYAKRQGVLTFCLT